MGPPAFAGGNSGPVATLVIFWIASMGPPAFAGGNDLTGTDLRGANLASMGPPAFAGGNKAIRLFTPPSNPLQWGHRLSPVETRTEFDASLSAYALQWGHRLSPVETGYGGEWSHLGWRASMGPPAFAGGNHITYLAHAAIAVASMGPPAFAGGNSASGMPYPTPASSFNGATGFRRWKPRSNRVIAWVTRASMGPPAFAGGNLISCGDSAPVV